MTRATADISELLLEELVKVKVCLSEDEAGQKRNTSEDFTFDFDPQNTNYSTLRQQLADILHIENYFTISFEKDGKFIPLTSDFDLDGAIFEASQPYLTLLIDLKAIDKTLEEWDIIVPADIPPMDQEHTRCSEERRSLAGSIISHVETCVQKVHRALTFDFNNNLIGKSPMNEELFNSLLDNEGRVFSHRKLHLAVYSNGVEPSLRPVVWKHLLNVFPHGMTAQDREAYLSSKCVEYYQLRYRWQKLITAGTVPEVLNDITNMVRKDARRTDRGEKFYSGSDDNENVRALFNILTTYAVNHPGTSYCQGMSDLLSPILYIMKTEPVAYICFCGLMKRLHTNFKRDGRSLQVKFKHLQKMVRFYDKELYQYLKDHDALDFVFCYRWLLLELKREFPYNDMLNVMEVIWGSLPPRPPDGELRLYKVKFPTQEIYQSLKDRTRLEDRFVLEEDHFGESDDDKDSEIAQMDETTAAKIARWTNRVRRESMARNFKEENESSDDEVTLPVHYRKRKYRSYIAGKLGRLNRPSPSTDLSDRSCKIPERKNSHHRPEICQSWSCGETFDEEKEYRGALYDAREFLRSQWCYSNTINEIQLNNWLNRRRLDVKECAIASKIVASPTRHRHGSNDSSYSTVSEDYSDTESEGLDSGHSRSEGYMTDDETKAAAAEEESDVDSDGNETDCSCTYNGYLDSMVGTHGLQVETNFDTKTELLPPPHVLGDGNPFLLFLCLSLLQSQKEEILRKKLDFNDLAIYFDKFVRKHKINKAMRNAQRLFKQYLNMKWDAEDKDLVASH